MWVYRGAVGVRALALEGAREVMVREGFRAVGGADGPAEVFLLDHGDPWNGWADAPPPRSAAAAPPARRADDVARESVRREAQDRALALTLARNPGLASRLKAMRAELAEQTDRELKGDGIESLELSTVDPLLDATTEDVELALKSRYLEQVLSSPTDALKVRLTQNLIEVVTSSGQTYNFDPQTIEAIRMGSAPLPSGFDTLVAGTGEDPAVVMTLISELMRR